MVKISEIVEDIVPFQLSDQAYLKIFFHAAKHPHRPVNGVLLGLPTAGVVVVEDAIPLLHHWTSLSPMMEIGLDLARSHAESIGLKVVGYYQSCAKTDDTSLAPVGERVAAKIKEGFKEAVAFVIDGEKLGNGTAALVPYLSRSGSTSWKPFGPEAAFTPGSLFTLASQDVPVRAVQLVRDARLHQKFGDFDDHLEDVSIDWLHNKECLADVT